MNYQTFPQPQHIKSHEVTHVLGANKSKRSWKVGANRNPQRNYKNEGNKMTWQEKKKRAQEMKGLRDQLKQYKQKKIIKRKQQKQYRKLRNKQKQYNQIKAGKFEVIKNPKNIHKWSKKLKQKLVNLPAQVFESLLNK